MKKKSADSGLFHPRIFLAFILCSVGVSLALASLHARPSTRTAKRSSAATSTASRTAAAPQAPTTPATPGTPRYYNYAPGPGIGESAGEPTIGFNPFTKRVMYISGLQTLQVTLPENITPLGSVPAPCPADWKDVSFASTSLRSLDPILFTDQGTGRTFVSQLNSVSQTSPLLIGLNSLMAYTDTDGEPNPANPNNEAWTPAQVNPPDGSNDHQTVGAGPYPISLPLGNDLNKGSAVYYCAQGGYVLVATSAAFCSRSDDGGLNFGKSVPIYLNQVAGCAQGIHGHVKVAPDGTVYVPNAQCGGGQAATVSTDAGTTWAVHTVPGTAVPSGILDPSIGISKDPPVAPATSNTIYFCGTGPMPDSAGGDNHPFCAVSKDRGVTWSEPVDIGAQLGIKNAVFASTVAGDSDRAACAFLGTTTSGNHQAANFQGTWYGFVAHTYDGGQTWTTVNASGGPVQRNACIWNGGGSNPCRNLLDFNDITIDDKGRVLFAFADGCTNECEIGGPNSYSSKATFARQSGGRTLFSQFDVEFPEPVVPQRACLSGCRDDKASYLSWIAPDNGGSDLTGYNIYRSDATHAEALIGQQTNPTDNTFNDRSVDPTIASYTYRITALNALGEGPASNSESLPLAECLTAAGPCLAPGVTALVDPAGDASDTLPEHDITSVSMAEPMDVGDPTGKASNVVITIKVANLATVPQGWRWSLRFGVIKNGTLLAAPPSGIPGDTSVSDYFVSMVSDGGASAGIPGDNSFTWGVTSTPNGAARLFTTKGAIHPSSNVTADGTITLVLPKSIIQNPGPGDSIALTLASVRLGSPSGGTNETIPDSTGAGAYVLRPVNLCLPNTPPLAILTANVSEGIQPLQVNFDASASSDPDAIDTIASYTFNFGDGGDDVTQASPTISHIFNSPGIYVVKLVVTDSRGKVSSNTAQFFVTVSGPLSTITSRKVHGAAGAFDILLPITGTAGIENRAPATGNAYQLIFTFARNITNAGNATKGSGNATVGPATIGPAPNEVTVPLTNVTNAQHLFINLNGVGDVSGGTFYNMSARMDVLVGDTTADAFVNSADISQTKSRSGQAVSSANFRSDVTVDGFLNSADISSVKSRSGTALP